MATLGIAPCSNLSSSFYRLTARLLRAYQKNLLACHSNYACEGKERNQKMQGLVYWNQKMQGLVYGLWRGTGGSDAKNTAGKNFEVQA